MYFIISRGNLAEMRYIVYNSEDTLLQCNKNINDARQAKNRDDYCPNNDNY